jgi:hypothetical protein
MPRLEHPIQRSTKDPGLQGHRIFLTPVDDGQTRGASRGTGYPDGRAEHLRVERRSWA